MTGAPVPRSREPERGTPRLLSDTPAHSAHEGCRKQAVFGAEGGQRPGVCCTVDGMVKRREQDLRIRRAAGKKQALDRRGARSPCTASKQHTRGGTTNVVKKICASSGKAGGSRCRTVCARAATRPKGSAASVNPPRGHRRRVAAAAARRSIVGPAHPLLGEKKRLSVELCPRGS